MDKTMKKSRDKGIFYMMYIIKIKLICCPRVTFIYQCIWVLTYVVVQLELKKDAPQSVVYLQLEYMCQFLHDIKIPKGASTTRARGVLIVKKH